MYEGERHFTIDPEPFLAAFERHMPEQAVKVDRFDSGSCMIQCSIGDEVVTAELSVLRGYGLSVDDARDAAAGTFALPQEEFDSFTAALRRLEEMLHHAKHKAAAPAEALQEVHV